VETGQAQQEIHPAEGVATVNQVSNRSQGQSLPQRLVSSILMKKYSNNKEINSYVKQLLKADWTLVRHKNHPIIKSPNGRRIAVPSSPSVKSSVEDFFHAVKRINSH